nr:hypothetical protein [Streptomyces sp. st77]
MVVLVGDGDTAGVLRRRHPPQVVVDVGGRPQRGGGSRLQIIDSFVARTLMELTTVARLLGARVVVAGMLPPVSITLVELGIELTGVETALNAERGMALLGWQQTRQLPKGAARAALS